MAVLQCAVQSIQNDLQIGVGKNYIGHEVSFMGFYTDATLKGKLGNQNKKTVI